MKLEIKHTTAIDDLKKQFSRYYPFLKLEFYKTAHKEGEGSVKADLIKEDILLDEIRTKENIGIFEITPETTVSEVEQGFEDKFGIHVQVFRKSRGLWLETTTTDTWTLNEQNKTGEEMES